MNIEMVEPDDSLSLEPIDSAPFQADAPKAERPKVDLELQNDGTVKVSDAAALVNDSVEKVSTAITTFNKAEAAMGELEATYKGFVVEATPKGLEEAAKALAAIREPRFTGNTLLDGAKKLLNKLKTDMTSQYEAYAARCKALEDPIAEQVKAIKDAKAIAKAKEEQAERERVERIQAAIETIRNIPLGVVGGDIAALQVASDTLGAINPEDGTYEEFAGAARRALDTAAEVVNGMLMAKQMEADEAAEQERQRLENQRAQADLRQQAADLKRQQEAFAEQQRIAKEEAERPAREAAALTEARRNRMHGMQRLADSVRTGTAASINVAIQALATLEVTEADYGEMLDEAKRVRTELLSDMGRWHAAAFAAETTAAAELAERQRKEREAEEQRQREEAQRQADAAALGRAQRAGPITYAALKRLFIAARGVVTLSNGTAEDELADAIVQAEQAMALVEGKSPENGELVFIPAEAPASITQADVDATNAEIQGITLVRDPALAGDSTAVIHSTRELVEGVLIKNADTATFDDETAFAAIGIGEEKLPMMFMDVEEILGVEMDQMDLEVAATVGDLVRAAEAAVLAA